MLSNDSTRFRIACIFTTLRSVKTHALSLLGLLDSCLAAEEVAVDDSFFNANASKQGIYTDAKLDQQLACLDKKIADYQQALAEQDRADDAAGKSGLADDEQLQQKLALLQAKQAEKKALRQQFKDSGDSQAATVDPDARLLNKRGQTVAGYNVQIVVDAKHLCPLGAN